MPAHPEVAGLGEVIPDILKVLSLPPFKAFGTILVKKSATLKK